jgi:pimeloyl-ACP methyl ester carboxylesterase
MLTHPVAVVGGSVRARLSALAAAVLLLTGLVPGAFASAQEVRHPHSATPCPSVDGPKCSVRLRTGITMAYVETGPRHGRPLILLHGLTDTSRSWSLAMADLHRRRPDLHLYALDLRGQGGSSMPTQPGCRVTPEDCFEMSDLARDVVAFLDTQHLRRASFAGHSMGTFVAQELGLRHPKRVDKLVLLATSTTGVGNPTLRDFVLPQVEGPWRDALVAKGLTWPQGAYLRTPLDADPDAVAWMKANWDVDPVAPPSLVDAISPETAHVRLGTWIGETKALLATDNTRRLTHLRAPTLVLWGSQDSIFYRSDQDAVIAALTTAAKGCGSFVWKQYGVRPLPSSGFQEDEIGHNVQWEAPAQVARDIDSFLRRGTPTRDLFHTDHPADVHRIVTEPGAATIVSHR